MSLTSWGQLLLVASPKSGIKTAGELVAKAKAQPGALNYGSPGVGTPHHLSMELFKNDGRRVRSRTCRIAAPARRSPTCWPDTIDAMFLPIHVALQHVKAGSLRGAGRSAATSGIRCCPRCRRCAALDMGDLDVEMWYGVMAPAGTPRPMIDRLNTELKGILALPEVKTAFQTQGMDPAHSSPAEFQNLVRKDADRWAKLIQAQKITAN